MSVCYVLLEVEGEGPPGENFDAIPHQGVGVKLLACGSAPAALRVAAQHCTADELHAARLSDIPAIHRKVGAAEGRGWGESSAN